LTKTSPPSRSASIIITHDNSRYCYVYLCPFQIRWLLFITHLFRSVLFLRPACFSLRCCLLFGLCVVLFLASIIPLSSFVVFPSLCTVRTGSKKYCKILCLFPVLHKTFLHASVNSCTSHISAYTAIQSFLSYIIHLIFVGLVILLDFLWFRFFTQSGWSH